MGFGMNIKVDPRDSLFSKMVRERDGRCMFCGKGRNDPSFRLENSHFWGRGNKVTRFDAFNCDALCFQCHVNNEGNKQGFYRTWKIEQLGEEMYQVLEKRASLTGSYGEYEKKLIHAELKRQYQAKEHLEPGWRGILYKCTNNFCSI